jgi:hypothetical protein
MSVAAFSNAEGFLETRWFDLSTHQSHRYNTNPEHLVRLRVWTDLISPRETQIVVETVYRSTIDPSVPDREVERVVAKDTPGDSLTQAVRAAVKEQYQPAPVTKDSTKVAKDSTK